jgi:hypothetical protein
VIESVGEHAQAKGLGTVDGFQASLAIGEHSCELRHSRERAAVLYLFDFNGYSQC